MPLRYAGGQAGGRALRLTLQVVSSSILPSPSSRLRRLLPLVAVLLLAAIFPATSGAALPGANGRIALEQSVQSGPNEYEYETGIWSVNPDGSGLTKLAGTSEREPREAAYSPDGSRIVYGYYDELWTAAADGSGAHVLSAGNDREREVTRWVHDYEDPETGTEYTWVKIEEEIEERDAYSEPSFSPDGAALAVRHYTGTFAYGPVCETTNNGQPCSGAYHSTINECRDCGSSIDAISSTTGAPLGTLVARSVEPFLQSPIYSSTGGLAYERISTTPSYSRQIFYIPAPGSAPVSLVTGQEPDFSPDGSRIVFAVGRNQIGILPVTGGTPTVFSPPQPPGSSSYSTQSPIWSPDGSSIAIGDLGGTESMMRYTLGGIYLMPPDGSSFTPILPGAAVPTGWQPLPVPAPPKPSTPTPTPLVVPVRAHALKGKKRLRLSRKGVAVAGKVACGTNPCGLKVATAKVKIGKKSFGIGTPLAKKLAPGASTPVKVKLGGKALVALEQSGKGALRLTVGVTEAAGTERLAFAAKLLPPLPPKRPTGR